MWPHWSLDEPELRLGTCSWSLKEWEGPFYTPGLSPQAYIAEYSRRMPTVEIDSSFYGTPRDATLELWRQCTPDGFLFAAKAPQLITHQKCMVDCGKDVEAFLRAMSILGDRLGPILFQFQYYSRKKDITQSEFMARLDPFIEELPKDGFSYVFEIRNKSWISEELLALLRSHDIPLALNDHPYMYGPDELMEVEGILSGPYAYIRWLGDRYAIEKVTQVFNQTVIDRGPDLARWVPVIKHILDSRKPVFGYFNNHYSGYAAADVQHLLGLLRKS